MFRQPHSQLAWLALIILLSLGLAGMPRAVWAQTPTGYQIEQVQVDLRLQPNGGLVVAERSRLRMGGGDSGEISRTVPRVQFDQIQFSQASLNGAVLPLGSGPGQVTVSNLDPVTPGPASNPPLQVVWHLSPSSGQPIETGLDYQVSGAVRQTPQGDSLIWTAIPAEHAGPIGQAVVNLRLPPGVSPSAPVESSVTDAEIELGNEAIRVTARDLAANTPLRITVHFPAGSLISEPPQWQVFEQTRGHYVIEALPLGLYAGLVISILGLTYLLMMVVRTRRDMLNSAPANLVLEPPQDLPPALAGVLQTPSFQPSRTHALATLFDLANRGLLRITEERHGLFNKRDFRIHRTGPIPGDLRPHESGLLDLIFATRKGHLEDILLSKLGSRLEYQWKKFAAPLEAELEATGYVDPARVKERQRAFTFMSILALVSGSVWIGSMIWFATSSSLGRWEVLTPAAILVGGMFGLLLIGLVGMMILSMYSPLTFQGEQAALQWRRFTLYLRVLMHTPQRDQPPDIFQRYLPYAAALGFTAGWIRAFQRQLVQPPDWFQLLTPAKADEKLDGLAAFARQTGYAGSDGRPPESELAEPAPEKPPASSAG